MFLAQPITVFIAGDLNAATLPAFAGVGNMRRKIVWILYSAICVGMAWFSFKLTVHILNCCAK